jgi:hypothetical protein
LTNRSTPAIIKIQIRQGKPKGRKDNMKVKTTKTMEFTFTEEERKAIELTRTALMVVKETMNTVCVDAVFETENESEFTYDKVEDAVDLLGDLLDGNIWEEID